MDASQAAPTQGVETALQVLGGKWKVLIVWHLLGRDSFRYQQTLGADAA